MTRARTPNSDWLSGAPRRASSTPAAKAAASSGAVHQRRQRALLAERGEQFSRHEGMHAANEAALHAHPFAVGAGQHEPAVAALRLQHQRTQQLRFFAAHDIGVGAIGIHLAVARHEQAIAVERLVLHAHQPRRQFGQRHGDVEIGRSVPALGAADHAGRQYGNIGGMPSSPPAGAPATGRNAGSGRQDALVVLVRVQAGAACVHEIGAPVAGAPVYCQYVFVHYDGIL
jgi:hypothetical protein